MLFIKWFNTIPPNRVTVMKKGAWEYILIKDQVQEYIPAMRKEPESAPCTVHVEESLCIYEDVNN